MHGLRSSWCDVRGCCDVIGVLNRDISCTPARNCRYVAAVLSTALESCEHLPRHLFFSTQYTWTNYHATAVYVAM